MKNSYEMFDKLIRDTLFTKKESDYVILCNEEIGFRKINYSSRFVDSLVGENSTIWKIEK